MRNNVDSRHSTSVDHCVEDYAERLLDISSLTRRAGHVRTVPERSKDTIRVSRGTRPLNQVSKRADTPLLIQQFLGFWA